MKDLYNGLAAAVLIGAAVLSSTSAPAAVDLQGFNSAMLTIEVGIGGITFDATNKVEFIFTHSDDDSTYTAVTDADVLGVTGITGGIVKSLVAAHAAADVTRIGYIGGKRYIKLVPTFSGTHGTGTPIAVLVMKGHAQLQPVS